MIDIKGLIINTIAILFVLTTHEFAHGLVAYWNGDNTAKKMHRLTLNPLKHLDLLGTISMIFLKFGWAKPVPIDTRKFTHRRFGLFTVSMAGIIMNFLTSFIVILILPRLNFDNILTDILKSIALYGIVLGVFNFIPVPPLDGSKILASLLPVKFEYLIYKYEKYSYIILIILIMSGAINKFIYPIIEEILRLFFYISLGLGF